MLLCVASDVMDFEKPENVKKDDVVMEYKGECGGRVVGQICLNQEGVSVCRVHAQRIHIGFGA
jgi:hypothetical protein